MKRLLKSEVCRRNRLTWKTWRVGSLSGEVLVGKDVASPSRGGGRTGALGRRCRRDGRHGSTPTARASSRCPWWFGRQYGRATGRTARCDRGRKARRDRGRIAGCDRGFRVQEEEETPEAGRGRISIQRSRESRGQAGRQSVAALPVVATGGCVLGTCQVYVRPVGRVAGQRRPPSRCHREHAVHHRALPAHC